jgi:hypothetical protein
MTACAIIKKKKKIAINFGQIQTGLASLAADAIPKHQFGGRNGVSTVDAIAKLINYA